ncbi:MAG: hypothetical protein JNL72_03750 [Flavipsychrobacter sp.]|nr:hypothetical protein [Flavipsychrobacter sp.]
MHNCLSCDKNALTGLAELHEDCYSNEQSLVFTHVPQELLQALKAEELDSALNIAPQMIEAIDIVNMEILERDLFGEEE